MSTLPFAHLHCHSHYSLLDGAGSITGLLERAKALRMNALALTDHGNMHGALEFYRTAGQLGIGWNTLFRFDHEAVGRVSDLPDGHRVVSLVFLGEDAGSGPSDAPWVQLR